MVSLFYLQHYWRIMTSCLINKCINGNITGWIIRTYRRTWDMAARTFLCATIIIRIGMSNWRSIPTMSLWCWFLFGGCFWSVCIFAFNNYVSIIWNKNTLIEWAPFQYSFFSYRKTHVKYLWPKQHPMNYPTIPMSHSKEICQRNTFLRTHHVSLPRRHFLIQNNLL